jgi:glycerol-3-phosphate dehydrogenase
LTIEVVRQAAAFGAVAANHAAVDGLLGDGRVRGARVVDELTGRRLDVAARVTVNATGVWADRIVGMATASPPRLRPSKGVHLVFDRRRVPVRSGVMVPSVAGDGVLVFLIPWGPRVFAGTTDTSYDGPLEDPPVEASDAEVILRSVSRAFGELSADDVVASWAGIRPLLDTGAGSTRDLPRRHMVLEDPPGLVTVTGGKLTTYRTMAEDVVDVVCRGLGTGGPCRTARLPLGSAGPLAASVRYAEAEVRTLDLPPEVGRRLVQRYGDDWPEAVALIREDASLAEEVTPGFPVRRVELALARSREMAITDDDVLVRRTRLAPMGVTPASAEGDVRSSARGHRAGR